MSTPCRPPSQGTVAGKGGGVKIEVEVGVGVIMDGKVGLTVTKTLPKATASVF